MASEVQRLQLQIDANATLLRQELAKSIRNVDDFADKAERGATRATSALGKIGGISGLVSQGIGGIAAALAGISFVGVVRGALEFADSMDAAAEQAGIAAERYQTLREGLRSLEVPAEMADKIFRRLIGTLGEVQGGTAGKSIVAVFDRMGITAKIMNGEIASTDQLIDAMAAAASRYTTQAQFAADVSELVGKKMGPQLANALKDGGVALREQEQAFRDAGAVLSDDYLKRLAHANERIDAFTASTQSTFAIWAAGILELFDGLGDGIDRAMGRIDASTKDGARDAYKQARETRENLQKGTFGFIPVAPQAIANAKRNERAALDTYLNKAFPLNQQGGFGPTAAAPAVANAKPGTPPVAAARLSAAGLKVAPVAPFETVRETFPGGALSVDRKVANLGMGFGQQADDLQRAATLMAEIRDASFEVQPISPISPEALALTEQFSQNLTQGLGQAIVYGQDIGKALISSIKAAAAQLIASQLLNLLTGGKAGGGGFLGSIFSAIAGKETGGPVAAGQPYIVGEKRPELFVPTTSGYIMPRVPNSGGKDSGGGHVTVSLDQGLVAKVVEGAVQVSSARSAEMMRQANRQRVSQSPGA